MKYNDISIEQLAKLQKLYGNKEYLTVEEAGVGLGMNPAVVRRHLRKGTIRGIKPFGCKNGRINVKQTKKLLDKKLQKSERINNGKRQ